MTLKYLSIIGLTLLASCVTPLPESQLETLTRWAQRLESTATDLSMLSSSKATREWSGKVAVIMASLKEAIRSGNIQTVQGIINELRGLKVTLIKSLQEEGVKSESILAIAIGFDLALSGLEEAL